MNALKKYLNSHIPEYRSIDTLPAWNWFFGYKKTKDVRFIMKLKDYDKLPEITPLHTDRLQLICDEIELFISDFEIHNNKRTENIFELTKQLQVEKAKYYEVFAILMYLSQKGHDEDIEALLKKHRFTIKPDRDFNAELERIKNQNENAKIKIDELVKEYEALTKTDGKQIEIEELIINIERHNKMQIDLRTISVKKYLMLKKDFSAYVEKMKATETAKKR